MPNTGKCGDEPYRDPAEDAHVEEFASVNHGEWTYVMIMITYAKILTVIMPMALSEGAQRGAARLTHPASDPDSLGPSLMRPRARSKARSLSTCPSAR